MMYVPSVFTCSTNATWPAHPVSMTTMAPATGIWPSGRMPRALDHQVQASPVQVTVRRLATYQVHWPYGKMSAPPLALAETPGTSYTTGTTSPDGITPEE